MRGVNTAHACRLQKQGLVCWSPQATVNVHPDLSPARVIGKGSLWRDPLSVKWFISNWLGVYFGLFVLLGIIHRLHHYTAFKYKILSWNSTWHRLIGPWHLLAITSLSIHKFPRGAPVKNKVGETSGKAAEVAFQWYFVC